MNDTHKIPGWITWLSGAILTAMSTGVFVAAYAFTNFETLDSARAKNEAVDARVQRIENTVEKRLDRIEDKLDRVLGADR